MFSEKYGYKQEKKIQIKSITKELRNRIWNLFYQCELKPYEVDENFWDDFLSGNPTIEEKIVDKLGLSINSVTPPKTRLRTYIEQSAKWYEVYDVVEIYISFLDKKKREQRTKQLNTIFEQEKSGYRIVLGEITPITNRQTRKKYHWEEYKKYSDVHCASVTKMNDFDEFLKGGGTL